MPTQLFGRQLVDWDIVGKVYSIGFRVPELLLILFGSPIRTLQRFGPQRFYPLRIQPGLHRKLCALRDYELRSLQQLPGYHRAIHQWQPDTKLWRDNNYNNNNTSNDNNLEHHPDYSTECPSCDHHYRRRGSCCPSSPAPTSAPSNPARYSSG